MKETSKESLMAADKKDKVTKTNVGTLNSLHSMGLFRHITEEDVQDDQAIENILMPFDVGEKELPDAIARNIQEHPHTGRFTLAERLNAIWLMEVMQDSDKVPLYKIVTMVTGFGVKTLQHWWKNRQKWLEYNTNFTNTSLRVIKMNFIMALLKSSNALNSIDFTRLAKSHDPRHHANLLKMTEGLATRVAMSDRLLDALDAVAGTDEVEGEVPGVTPVAPEDDPLGNKNGDKKDNEVETDKEPTDDKPSNSVV